MSEIVVTQDDCPECPLGWWADDKNVIALKGLGHLSDCGEPTAENVEELEVETAEAAGNGFSFAVYRYEHSAVAYSLSPFSCPWDSGIAGYITCDAETYEEAKKECAARIEEFMQWCNGDVYCVSDGEDTCCGIYAGSEEEAIRHYLGNAGDKLVAAYEAQLHSSWQAGGAE